jgi:ribosomal protein S18 acetylase RimI-like enzyme
MFAATKSKKLYAINRLAPPDLDALCEYLEGLSPITKSRFGPHDFKRQSIIDFYQYSDATGYKAIDAETKNIIGYAIVYKGILPHERERLLTYEHVFNPARTAESVQPGGDKREVTFAPSVADGWHGEGVGFQMLQFILKQLQDEQFKRVFLWGGVRKENKKAVEFYLKNGFKIIGSFTYNGENLDMALDL